MSLVFVKEIKFVNILHNYTDRKFNFFDLIPPTLLAKQLVAANIPAFEKLRVVWKSV